MKYKYVVKAGFAINGVYFTPENASELSKFSHGELESFVKAGLLVAIPEKGTEEVAPVEVAEVTAPTPSKKR